MCPVLLFAEYPNNGISLCVGLHTSVLNPENLYIKFCFALEEFEKKNFLERENVACSFQSFCPKKASKTEKKLRTGLKKFFFYFLEQL